MIKVAVTRPEHDDDTTYLSFWMKDVIKMARELNFQVKDFHKEHANKSEFEKFVRSQHPQLILLNGHGDTNGIYGHDNIPIIVNGKNEDSLDQSIVHALACESMSVAENAVRQGAIGFFGYKKPFGWLTDQNSECVPQRDRLANIFKAPAIEVPKNLLRGKSLCESYGNGIEKYQETLQNFSASDAPLDAEWIRLVLFSNMMALELKSKTPESTIHR